MFWELRKGSRGNVDVESGRNSSTAPGEGRQDQRRKEQSRKRMKLNPNTTHFLSIPSSYISVRVLLNSLPRHESFALGRWLSAPVFCVLIEVIRCSINLNPNVSLLDICPNASFPAEHTIRSGTSSLTIDSCAESQ
jgi:hypothetical protein